MELDITDFFNTEEPQQYSASVAEIGNNAGKVTWDNALECSRNFVTEENKAEFISFFDGFGAWDDLEDWPINELNALVIQYISGDIREFEDCDGWEDYEDQSEAGRVSGRIHKGDDNRIYFYVGE